VKPWQIVLVVLAVVATAFSLFRGLTRDDGINMPDTVYYVDVLSGTLYAISADELVVVPGKSPEFDERSLWPASRDESGWVVAPRYLDALRDSKIAERTVGVDLESGKLESGQEPELIRYRR